MKKVAIGLALVGAASIAMPAAASGLYLAADVNNAKYEISGGSESATGFNVAAGWQFSPYFGAELSYRDLGSLSESESAYVAGEGQFSVEADVDFSATQLSLTAGYPVNDSFTLYGRAGVADIKLDARISATGGGSSASDSGSISETRAVFGVGVSYNFSPNVALRAEYNQFADVEDLEISALSIGLKYQF